MWFYTINLSFRVHDPSIEYKFIVFVIFKTHAQSIVFLVMTLLQTILENRPSLMYFLFYTVYDCSYLCYILCDFFH